MRLLEKIWEDIRHGENIDQYATIVFAFALGILGLLGITTSESIASLTLAVLGLLAVSNLVNRHRVEELSQKLSQSSKGFFLEEFPPEFKRDFQSAKEVLLIGVTLSRLIKTNYGIIEEKLRKGHTVKVLLVHPEGSPLEMAANRYYAEVSRSTVSKGVDIVSSLMLFCGLRKSYPKYIEIRTIQSPLTFGAVCLNMNSTLGIMYLEHFPYRTVADAQPKFVLQANDGRWYELFKKEVHALWNSGNEWKCIDESSK